MRLGPPSWALALLASTACSVDANYTLQLTPRIPVNESPFEDSPEVHLRLVDALGNVDWISIGELAAGTIEENGFGPLSGHTLGVGLGGDPAEDLGSMFAYGQAGPVTAGADKEQLEVPVLIAERDGVGTLGDLTQPANGASVAVLSNGDVYFFGGARVMDGACSTSIQKLTDLNAGDWTVRPIYETLPDGVCFPVVNVVQLGTSELIVISGGETLYGRNTSRVRTTSIFVPSTETIQWTGEGAFSRSRDFGTVTDDGRILYVGAHQISSQAAPTQASYEFFDPETKTFEGSGLTGVRPWGFMASPVSGGVALCGGGEWTGSTVTPSRDCEIRTDNGGAEFLPRLPVALRDGGMTTLADGRLLVAGGIAQTGQAGLNLAAQSRAWVLDPDGTAEWDEVAPLETGRSFFRLIADPYGGAIALGGAGAGWAFRVAPMAVPECGEVFHADGSWTPMDPCGAGGSGLLPTVGIHPTRGIITLQGRTEKDDVGGSAFGIVSLGPGI